MLIFKDLNFKLAVMQVLMYEKELLPAFNLDQFVKTYKKRKINIDKEGHNGVVYFWFTLFASFDV
jgi:hypothetical protein